MQWTSGVKSLGLAAEAVGLGLLVAAEFLVRDPVLRYVAAAAGAAVLVAAAVANRQAGSAGRGRLLDALPEALALTDARQRLTFVNAAFCEMFAMAPRSLVGKTAAQLLPVGDAKRMQEANAEVLRTGRRSVLEVGSKAGGDARRILATKAAYRDRLHRKFVVTLCRDVTDAKQAEEERRRSEERLALVLQGSSDGFLDWDLDTGKVFVSDSWKAMLGYATGDFAGETAAVLACVHPDDDPLYQEAKAAHFRGETPRFEMELRMRHKDGSYRWMLSRGRVVRDSSGRPVRLSGVQTDITRIKHLEERLRHESSRDPVTGLFTRAHFLTRLEPAMAAARRHGDPLALCMSDLDRFKILNDEHGHAAGDRALGAFGSAILAELREEDAAARYGGDEVCIFFSHATAVQATSAIDRIRRRFADAADPRWTISASFGVCDVVAGDDPAGAFAAADRALYRAKAAGRDRVEVAERLHPEGAGPGDAVPVAG